MEELFREKAECVKIYPGTETIVDPYEKNVEVSMLNPVPVKAIVSDLVASQSMWKIPGIEANKAKEIIIKKKYENLLKASQKIDIRGEFYYGWKVNGQLQYRIEDDYLRAYVYFKQI